jgi:hypothetical protein
MPITFNRLRNERTNRDLFFYVETELWDHDPEQFLALGREGATLLIDPVLAKYAGDPVGKTGGDINCGDVSHGRSAGISPGLSASTCPTSWWNKAKAAAAAFSNLGFVAGNGVVFPLASETAHFVWSYEVFQHMPSHDVVKSNLVEVARILRPSSLGLILPNGARIIRRSSGISLSSSRHLSSRGSRRCSGRTADTSSRGAKPLPKNTIAPLLRGRRGQADRVLDDPTHARGSRSTEPGQSDRPTLGAGTLKRTVISINRSAGAVMGLTAKPPMKKTACCQLRLSPCAWPSRSGRVLSNRLYYFIRIAVGIIQRCRVFRTQRKMVTTLFARVRFRSFRGLRLFDRDPENLRGE